MFQYGKEGAGTEGSSGRMTPTSSPLLWPCVLSEPSTSLWCSQVSLGALGEEAQLSVLDPLGCIHLDSRT